MSIFDDYERHRKRRARAHKRGRTNGDRSKKCSLCQRVDCKLEVHHLAGGKFDDVAMELCRDCHDKMSDCQQSEHPPIPAKLWSDDECFHRLLLGIIDLFEEASSLLRARVTERMTPDE